MSIFAIGPPGTGKSTVGNILLSGNPNSTHFEARDAPDIGGVTRFLSFKVDHLFGDRKNPFC